MGNTGVGKEDDRNYDDDVDCPKAGVENRGMAMERNGGTNAWTERLEPVEYFLGRIKWLQKKTVEKFLDLDQPEKVEERQHQFPSISLARPRRPRHVNLYSIVCVSFRD